LTGGKLGRKFEVGGSLGLKEKERKRNTALDANQEEKKKTSRSPLTKMRSIMKRVPTRRDEGSEGGREANLPGANSWDSGRVETSVRLAM